MVNHKQAKLAALKFLANIDPKADYSYAQVRQVMVDFMGGVKSEDDKDTLNYAMDLAFFKGYKIITAGVIFRGDAWHYYADAITDEMSYRDYTGYQIKDLTKQLLGVDIDDVISVLLSQNLISSRIKLTQGRYITVYTKNW